ncbi:cobalt chelatase [Methanosarcina sp. 2.H.T.1A.6]|uniref:cobaltochelatase subunit CobN n=1 Tax=unclassified Methanosarcina TaxID=2644672 RepID=UPI0006229E5F|nr:MULTISPECIES: cobaltochelatase subunit CobN [unclassified Methanosarcina]KKG16182.1 cobalt chelatase [Methanosarcina sp. 2.H.T.1A.3]KKG21559.1 cobalt chelatase [Methanosarcina sp. 2.H.T.1A.15]KKG23098.1 cobalt chelatase [Methanosarcina sp. 2.H.T.1A.6]KKG26321.1 cobalt chelatase [Methanosarcina sp. 2.H.T.1A.8]
MKEQLNNKRNPLNERIKASGLIILILLMLFSTSPAAGSEAIQYELVANTTSDAEGNYLLSGIPDGNYTLVALYNEDKWRRADEQIQVQGTDLSVNLDTSSRDIDANESQALLDLPGSGVDLTGSAAISGLTRQKKMGGDPISLGFTNVLLLREVVKEPQGNSSTGQHLDIAIVTGYRSHELPLKNLAEEVNTNSGLNLSLSCFMADYVMENNVDLSGMDIIYINMLSPSTAQKLTPTVDMAIANGCVVIDDDTLLNESIPLSADQIEGYREKLNNYWLNGAYDQSNLKNLVFCIANDCCGRSDLLYEDPHALPERAIYHTNMTGYFTDSLDTYLAWYSNRNDGGHIYDPAKPTVAITMYQSYFPFQIEPIDALISELEARGYNVIATYGSDSLSSGDFFKQGDDVLVDAIISFTYFGNKFDAEGLDVPVINGIVNNYMNRTEYEASSNPLPADKMMKLDLQELWGAIDPVIMASTELDAETETEVSVSIDYQVDWLVDRVESWVNLGEIPESDKKVAIIYYNHGGGKDNIGASYLDVVPSISSLLGAMAADGYDLNESQVPNQTELLDLMLTQGINIGTWAPGELQKLVDTGKIVLVPESTYEGWFSELPQERQQKVIDQWGPAPGKIMVWENESGKYLVIPRIEVGDNVLLAPQPSRGWLDDNNALYHDKDLPPHHQYIAFYLWLQHSEEEGGFGSNALVHFGRHGTQEWLPGKQFGLSRYDWPSLMIGDLPVIYPYVMDGLGEGNEAKRRGGAVIVDHLVPPIISAGSYGDYANLSTAIQNYEQAVADDSLKSAHRSEVLNLTRSLHLDEEFNMTEAENNENYFNTTFLEGLEALLDDYKSQSMPYGLHILGTSPKGEQLVGMVNSMLGTDFADSVHKFNETEGAQLYLLDLVLNRGVNSTDAQMQVLGTGSETVANFLASAEEYAANLALGEEEISQVLNALDGRFIPGNLGGDPVRNPETLPSGRNFYAFDQRIVPTEAAWTLGQEMADQMLDAYVAEHGTYPKKVAYILWAGETTRHEGVMEAEILYLLGVKPVWKSGRVVDVEAIPMETLGRPRVDVVIQISGLYRDMYPGKVLLLDKAVKLAYAQEDSPNYVRENAEALKASLMSEGSLNESDALDLALLRIFGSSDGAYGTGLPNAIAASDTWESNDVLADLYISKMCNAYGENVWGENLRGLFEKNLAGVEATVHSRSTNLYGTLDNDDFFQYMGGLNLAVSSVSGGKYPDSFITNMLTGGDEKVETLGQFLARETYSRYFNPKWIDGMQGNGYAGAREMADFIENLWGWEATNPDLISDEMWDQVYQTYMADQELREWTRQNNPYAYQSMTARMLETARKGNWDASDEALESLAAEYAESVVEDGVTCCHHTCGNPLLNGYVSGLVSVPGFSEAIEQATQESLKQEVPEKHSSSKGHQTSVAEKLNQTVKSNTEEPVSNPAVVENDAGYGVDSPEPAPEAKTSSDSDYVEGYEMKKESVENEEDGGGMSFSGADVFGIIFVLVAAGGIYLGMRKKNM